MSRSGTYQFVTTCVDSTAEAINDMLDLAKETTYRGFARSLGPERMRELEQGLGYGKRLALRDDYHVSYGRSWFQGQRCVYLCHSAIEHVFVSRPN